MSCCGSSRRAAPSNGASPVTSNGTSNGATTSVPATTAGHRTAGARVRPLVYRGPSALSVLGPVTGRVYRFAQPGAQLTVDPRDWAGLVRLPQLASA